MAQVDHDWVVFHRVRFATAIDGATAGFDGPETADAWRFTPHSRLGPSGARDLVSDDWGGLGVYATRRAAEAVFDHPERHLPFLAGAAEAYHALVVPVVHRGAVNLRGRVQEEDAIAAAPSDPGGALIVITSAGFERPGSADLPRIGAFLRGVLAVLDDYATRPDNLRRAAYGPAPDGRDGITVTLWRTDAAMLQAAYKSGHHRDRIDQHHRQAMVDRSSFTRGRILRSKGAWDGADPVAGLP